LFNPQQLAATSSGCVSNAGDSTPLRVRRAPLKRATGLPARGSLSRAYHGKSQSFGCMEDLARNPWAGQSSVALAKRRHMISAALDAADLQTFSTAAAAAASTPMDVPPRGALGASFAAPSRSDPGSVSPFAPHLELGGWSIDEGEVSCSVLRLDRRSNSGCDGGSVTSASLTSSRSDSGRLLGVGGLATAAAVAELASALPAHWTATALLSRRSWETVGSDDATTDVCMAGCCGTSAATAPAAAATAGLFVAEELSAALKGTRLDAWQLAA